MSQGFFLLHASFFWVQVLNNKIDVYHAIVEGENAQIILLCNTLDLFLHITILECKQSGTYKSRQEVQSN